MVKKIGGSRPPKGPTSPVESTKEVKGGSDVRSVKQVGASQQKAGAEGTRGIDSPLTTADREAIFQMISEEADKMFGPEGLPESQRQTVENAVQMAVNSGLVDEEEE